MTFLAIIMFMVNSDNKPQTLKGFRDFLPEEKRKRDYVLGKIIQAFEIFGFEPLETPTLEYASVLLGKYGKEADKLVYTFKDRGNRTLGLRYDQTVPTARVLCQYQNTLPKFFRRYQVQNVFRADKPQRGRFREFTQCDIDIFGSSSPITDAEIIATSYYAFKNIGFKKIRILVNDRQILFESLKPYTDEKVSLFSVIQTVDKADKIGQDKVIEELIAKGMDQKKAQNAWKAISQAKISDNLTGIISYAKELGVPDDMVEFSPTLARGLDYYTGMILEIKIPGYDEGACGGGGRYDELIGQLGGGVAVPAVGVAFGLDRTIEAADFFRLIPQENLGTQILITVFDQSTLVDSLKTAFSLRNKKIKTEVYPGLDKIDKQLKYADRKKIPYVIIIGPEEVSKNVIKLKDMKTGKQSELNLRQLLDMFI